MEIHKVTIMVADHDELGADGVRSALENSRYPNRCINPQVTSVETVEIEWSDGHALNKFAGWEDEFARLFPS